MRELHMPLAVALEHVFSRRAVLPNAGFYAVLERRQVRWLGSEPCEPRAVSRAALYAELSQRFVGKLSQQADETLERAIDAKRREEANGGWRPQTLEQRVAGCTTTCSMD